MTAKQRTINAVAGIMVEHLLYDGEPYTYADCDRINRSTGWTFEWSAPLGGVLRHEGVRLDTEDLIRAWQEAHRMARDVEAARA